MKQVIFFTLFLGIVSACLGAVTNGFYTDPKHPGKCTISENLIIGPGENVKDPNSGCGRIFCSADGFADFKYCGLVHFEKPRGCKFIDTDLIEDMDFPHCCTVRMECPDKIIEIRPRFEEK